MLKKRMQNVLVVVLSVLLAFSCMQNAVATKKIKSKKVTVVTKSATIGIGDIITLNAVMKPANNTGGITFMRL